MMKKIKKNSDRILIITSFAILSIFRIYTKINNISTTNTGEAFVGALLFGLPFFIGLWIYSNKIKDNRKTFSKIIKIFIIWACFVIFVTFIMFLVKNY